MELDPLKTAVAFVALIVAGVGGLLVAPMMTTNTVLTMVAPSMVVFGLICVAIGVAHGRYRATH
ncbi:DUF7333 family protein [Halostella salina]|uniref:DUF7333 family protein n=1 Tax=Halostella salina TaxID=1547897 RepID=UPI000EF84E19|nr:hypothetical protein [Halostella salina]